MKLAFLGLGRMGQGMASSILKAGHSLTVHNRSPEKCAPLKALGAAVAPTAAEAAHGADIVFSILADDAALAATASDECIQGMAPDGIHVSMSTVSIRIMDEMAGKHARLGRGFVGCPVFGRPEAAAAGALRLCVSGEPRYKDKVKPVLSAMGEVFDFGDKPSGSMAVKLAGNFSILAIIETLGEAFTLVEKNGVDPETFFNFVSTTMLAAPSVKTYGRLLLDANYDDVGFAAVLGAKDVGLVREAARRSNTPMPIAAIAEERYMRALARGWGEKDWIVTGLLQREDAGLVKP